MTIATSPGRSVACRLQRHGRGLFENSGPGLLGRLDREVEDGAAAGVSVTLAALVKLRGNLCRSPPQGRAAGRYTDRAGTRIQAADHWPTKPPLPIAARRRGGRLRRAIAV